MKILKTPTGESLQSIIEKESLNLDDPSLYFLLPDIPATIQGEKLFLKQGLWGERLLTFGKLSSLVNLRAERKFLQLSRMGRLFHMEEVVGELRDVLSYFKEIASIKGFSESLLRLVAELKHAKLAPADLSEIKEKVKEEFKKKLEDLARIFELYQKKLEEEEYIDDIDGLKLLSESVRKEGLKNILPEANTFIVFGFFDFTPSQLEVLMSINDAGFKLLIYLPSFGEASGLRAEVVGKMKEWFGDFEIKELPETPKPKRYIEIHSFPSFRGEAEFAAREAKKLILENSFKPDSIAVVLRSLSGEERDIMRGFEKLGIPYSMSSATSLRESPFGQFVMGFLRVKSSNFERRLFLQLLRSPYLAEFFSDVEKFDELLPELDLESRKRRVLGGLKEWRETLREFPSTEFAKSVEKIIDEIEKCFNSNTLGELTEELGGILGKLSVPKAVEKLSSKSDIERAAWEKFIGLLKELRFLSKGRFKRNLKLEDFISLLEDLMMEEKFSPTPVKKGRAWIMEALETRGTFFPVVFILDVGEKSFPFPSLRDPILKNDERAWINTILGKNALGVEKNHYESEEFIFKLICASAAKKLYVTYSYLDEKERAKLPSYLVEELGEREKIEVKRHTLEDSFLKPENIYTRGDLAKYLFYRRVHEKETFAEYLSKNWYPYRWILTGIQAERARLIPDGNYSGFEGIVTRKELLPDLTEFSPTRLETYGDCPFKYFAGKILGLEELDEVEDEVPVLDLGTFYHKVLKELFESLVGEMGGRVDLRSVTDREVLDKLQEALGKVDFDKEFHWLSPGIRDLAKRRTVDETLPQFILAEVQRIRDWNAWGFYPAHVEKELNFDIGNIKIKGITDRIDVGKEGALIIDYKPRSSSNREFFNYKNLQLPLYLSALRREGTNSYGGYYRFVERPEEEKGAVEGDKKASIRELINSAEKQVGMYVSLMKRGFFAPVIEKKEMGFEKKEIRLRKAEYSPCGWCEFSDLCRVQGEAKRRW
ncbi:MAG: PD-(D/E)XK nuclease family protein [Thermodesulfobacteriota bacterium]